MREAASFSPVYRRERDPERRDLAKISVHGGDFSQRGWRGLISILQVPHQPQNPHQPQDSVSSSTWHLRPILPQFWKPLWPICPPRLFIARCPGAFLLELHRLFPPSELQDFSKWVLSSVPSRTDPELGVVASPGALGRHFPPPPHWEVPPIV